MGGEDRKAANEESGNVFYYFWVIGIVKNELTAHWEYSPDHWQEGI